MLCSQSGGEDPLYYGITDALVEQVSCMTYNTFRWVAMLCQLAAQIRSGGMLVQ